MKERPMLMSAPMVRAILAGTKTQTRRVVKQHLARLGDGDWFAFDHKGTNYRVNARHTTVAAWANLLQFCPYGQPGDQLWVRETCQGWEFAESGESVVRYAADGEFHAIANTQDASDKWCALYGYAGKKGAMVPSIHMPRWASRITLEIVGVRVERLQDISRGDAMAEGCPFPNMAHGDDPRQWYAGLWEQINGPGSWDANPWVWAIDFKLVSPINEQNT